MFTPPDKLWAKNLAAGFRPRAKFNLGPLIKVAVHLPQKKLLAGLVAASRRLLSRFQRATILSKVISTKHVHVCGATGIAVAPQSLKTQMFRLGFQKEVRIGLYLMDMELVLHATATAACGKFITLCMREHFVFGQLPVEGFRVLAR